MTTCARRSTLPSQLDASGEQMFREVIPDGSARALSRYTDMVDALIRDQNDRLAAASDDARVRLRERDLPDCLQVGGEALFPGGGFAGLLGYWSMAHGRQKCSALNARQTCY